MRESEVEKHLVQRVKELGGEVRKVKWIGRDGAPDRLVMMPAPTLHSNPEWSAVTRTTWVELKAPGAKAKPHQLREHERMRKMGQRVLVIDSIEGVEAFLA